LNFSIFQKFSNLTKIFFSQLFQYKAQNEPRKILRIMADNLFFDFVKWEEKQFDSLGIPLRDSHEVFHAEELT
jgi:hypothetical protein